MAYLLASLEVREQLLQVGKEDEVGDGSGGSGEPSGLGSMVVPDAVVSGAEATAQVDASASSIASGQKDKKKLKEVAAASQSNTITVDDEAKQSEPASCLKKSKKCTHEASTPKGLQDIDLSQNHKHLCINIADTHEETDSNMDVDNKMEAGTTSGINSAEDGNCHSLDIPGVKDGSFDHSSSKTSDDGPSLHTRSSFIIYFSQEPDYQYIFVLPVEQGNGQQDGSIRATEGVFIMDPLKTAVPSMEYSVHTALPSSKIPPPYTVASGAASSPGTCILIVDMGNPFKEHSWHQCMIVTPHHGALYPLLTPECLPHLFQFLCSAKVCQLCQVSNF
ncbi:hypothetical protein BT96DRAFT_985291 [Gymnopus androsaceus JB14]|uniref:Uncharacterized protein n=1 Tax=Gymnopus androsaceus JB14 TaxID=1447944 RepID=A0A6A4IEF3_9AGAR|nr:hypothetical protein BT96DRAFT_985291 [Gymnopus androsaceus JB14]